LKSAKEIQAALSVLMSVPNTAKDVIPISEALDKSVNNPDPQPE